MSKALSYRTEAGDQSAILDLDYIFDRVDPDGSVFYRAPAGAKYGDFMVRGENGHFRRPTVDEMNDLFRKEAIKFKCNNKRSEQRRMAREMKLLADQVYEMDGKSAYREAITNFYDEHIYEYTHSKNSLDMMVARALKIPKIKALQPSDDWTPAGRTVLDWINDRGTVCRRKARDFMSMRGLMPHKIQLPHPEEIFLKHLLDSLTTSGKPNMVSFYNKYVNDIEDINKDLPLNRNLLEKDADGRWFQTEKAAAYNQPGSPYKVVSYDTFRRHQISNKTPNLFAVAVNQKGKRARYGGGGFGERHPFGMVCEIDDTPVNGWFLVDEETGIGMGTAVATLMIEPTTGAYIGWDLSGEHASSNSFLRTVRHGNFGKEVPADLREICPTLGDIRMRPTWLHTDNAAFAHSHDVESALADAYISPKYMGAEHPTDKSQIERELGTAKTSFFQKLPGCTYDIELMRQWGYEPETQQLCGIRKARELFDRYCHSRNLQKRKRLGKRAPAQMFLTQAMKDPPNVIENIDEFDIAMGKSMQDVSVYATGIDLRFGHYTSNEMGEIAAAFERMLAVPAGDITPKQDRRNSNPKKKLKRSGRIKYNPDDLGVVHLWVPEKGRERWEPLKCSNPDRHGMPEFLYEEGAALARKEGLEFITDQQQYSVMGKLYKLMENTSEASSLQRRKKLGRALGHDQTQASLKRFIGYDKETRENIHEFEDGEREEVKDEVADRQTTTENDAGEHLPLAPSDDDEHPFAEPMRTATSAMAPKHRKDGHVETPRPSNTKTKPRTYGERQRAASKRRTVHDRTTLAKQRTSKPRKTSATPGRRKFNRLKIGDIK